MATLSEEEKHYVRLALLLNGLTPRAVRTYFDREFPPTYLPSILNTNYNTLVDLKLKRILNLTQWKLLIPRNGVPDSKTFDVTLMICLIRNLTSMNSPINGFDSLPLPMETTPGPDLARIKWYRNMLARHDSNTIDTAYFNNAWREISDAVGRLGGQPMYQECRELEVNILDQSNQEVMLEIKQSKEEIRELGQTIHSLGTETSNVKENLRKFQDSYRTLQSEHSKVTTNLREVQDAHSTFLSDVADNIKMFKNPIPMNIREYHKKEVDTWQLEDHKFAETTASRRLFSEINHQNTSVITVIGPRGCGKSFLTKHVALKMQKENEYTIVPVDGLKKVIEWYDSNKKQLFVLDIDNACHIPFKLDHKVTKWQNQSATLQTKVNDDHKIIACCSTDTYGNPEFRIISILHQHKFDLKADDNSLSDKDFEDIASKHMEKDEVIALKGMEGNLKKLDDFPMLCKKFVDEKRRHPTQYFAEYLSLIANDTRVENSNTNVEINLSNSMSTNLQAAQGILVNPIFNNSPVTINYTVNTFNKK